MTNQDKNLKQIHQLPDGEWIVPEPDANELPPELNPYIISQTIPITKAEEI